MNSLSIIVPSYGRAGALCDLAGDLLGQTRRPHEILVIHQRPAVADPATARLRAWAAEGRIRLFEPDFANAQKARNLGIREATGELVLLLDDDIRVRPDLVECHLRNYENDSRIDGVVGQILEEKQQPTLALSPQVWWPHVGWQYFPLNYGARTRIENWPSTNSSVRRELAMAVGGFDEQFERTWLDDTDFSCRLRQAGARLVFDPAASIVHLKTPTGGRRVQVSPMLFADREGWATYFYFWRKNLGIWRARCSVAWFIRYFILRKAVLIRPHWMALNLWHLAEGWRLAARKLKQGPRYLEERLKAEGWRLKVEG
ncbi:MAG: glycosyltransferase [Verrucomicrobiae bacterium]|nr:glycosyltransferase [Verrucomicrobiae bacterium]